ncbi:MAG: hypothetical protein A2513_03215 [Sulfurimonas sp. RIFOXYD12_FULL_33_39]|uniref:hypothetical protein n=1 Tax=unclassified Sulfurimonas TaxID=2623549 RepID=UPI0008AD63A4|nr:MULTISPECIES: hypothetical protein [unclassified Sulfurimonas]OHE09001.1 MAG: hypothetical protein A2513_03215 [Sulfurimonas sp. RIFOXYD12_FULL_33_39]OHE14311.1 MAG: hypothetical protein A2530_06515 [Sulfurimonas sp. RIFOXYD2_FULL_34_21]DAB28378.1 MAG TPA: hypothetical protein CFH78_02750 [Sulfurimonas sp. UBA10385]
MKIVILVIFLFLANISAKDIKPYKYLKASDSVSDFAKADNMLIIGTEEGIVDIYDLEKEQFVDKITLKKQKNILGDENGILIISVDYLDDRVAFLTRELNTWGELYIYENKKLTKLIENAQHISLQKVKFLDKDRVIINTMGNELMLFDIKNKRFIYKKQLGLGSFSDLVLSEDKKYLFSADETPQINKIEINSGKVMEKYEEANKRDIFSIDYKNSLLLSGGKDKRVILYKTPLQYKMTKGDFFIQSVALNPDATKAAFTKNDNDEISIIDTNTLEETHLLKGHKKTVIKIDFYMSNELITADEGNQLTFWRLK